MSIAIHWFRRDLRLKDNAALHHATQSGYPVLPLFIFDTNILDSLEAQNDMRVTFIHREVMRLHQELASYGSSLLIRYGKPEEVWACLLEEYDIARVFANIDYEPYAKKRDADIEVLLSQNQVSFHSFKDHVIFHKNEVVKANGEPYVVFTPYKNKWIEKLQSQQFESEHGTETPYYLKPYPIENRWLRVEPLPTIPLTQMGFVANDRDFPPAQVTDERIVRYDETRDYPGILGTTRLSVHFRFGTISIRQMAARAKSLNRVYLNELIWRDFYAMILDHFPRVVNGPFRKKYQGFPWRNEEAQFEQWCTGKTGFPLVDAGMRQLNHTGFMHNRLRMLTASFLTKSLLIDWQWGEAYFAEKLLDYDLASNNGGWQWAAGCGTDAAPYFRIFNPTSQLQKYDPHHQFIKKWLPEWNTDQYPAPMVDHKAVRERCLAVFKSHLSTVS